ncbi:MAG: phosphoenolpyruvate--protein phosphotransferase [Legionellaceae bacterium]|nr:phosphoenolpyruvate--protein phosphotransferase [Legionellaceae bacterium]
MLKVLRRITEEVAAADDVSSAMNIIVSRVREAIDAPNCSIFLVDADKNSFILKAAVGLHEQLVDKGVIPFGQGMLSVIVERGEPINVADAQQDDRYKPLAVEGNEKFHGYLGVPIQSKRKLLGAIVVRQEAAEMFDEAEEAFLITIAAQLANVISQVELTGKISEATKNKRKKVETVLEGIAAVSGVALGEAMIVFPPADLDAVPENQDGNKETELVNLQHALACVRDEIRVLGKRLTPNLPKEEQVLFDAYLKLLDSNTLISEMKAEIEDGYNAQAALKRVIKRHALEFRGAENEYLQERASDLEDLGRRILSHLQADSKKSIDYPAKTILIGEEVMAADLAEVPEGQLLGVISGKGSVNSHVAILSRALGIPTVMGVGDFPTALLTKQITIVDGYTGRVYLSPSRTIIKEYRVIEQQERELDKDLASLRDMPAETEDGARIKLYVNTGLMTEVSNSMTVGAEGVGLYRTEVPFMLRDRFPTAEEQRKIYKQLLSAFSPLPVTMRTLDIGGDKQLSYFPIDDANPFLGWRGIRISLDQPEIFHSQVRAMMRASEGLNNLRIMLPMVSDISEVDEALSIIKKIHADILEEGVEVAMPEVGVMIEVPSAVYQAQALARRVDFLSVGSNDLTQYMLAVDRNNTRVSSLYNSMHPAVLHALQQVVDGAHKEGKTASVCGEMAGEPMSAILLFAMGYDALSMSATMLPRIKWLIRHSSISRARKLLSEVIELENPREIQERIEQTFEEMGVADLIRAGRE